MRISMVSIHVTEPAHAHRFYTEVLGFETALALPESDVYVVSAPGQDTGLLLEPSTTPIAEQYRSELRAAGIPVLVLSTDTLFSDIERLRGEGVHFVGDVFRDASGEAINFSDSVGNLIQLHQGAL
ncbi:MAG: VOC family protein [Propionibacteriaceae bacterium]|nr:VOC family protein [Propionibacteriaceae bacterium]